MARNFNQKEAEILLAEIKEFPAIYDPGDKTYNDFSVKGKVWLYIADKVGKNGRSLKFISLNFKMGLTFEY